MEKFPLVLSAVFVLIGLFAMIVGVATPFWYSNSSQHGGLWTVCFHDNVTDGSETCSRLAEVKDLHAWDRSVRALILIPCILSFINFMLIVAHISRGHDPKRHNFRKVSMVTLSVFSGLLCEIGTIVYFHHQDVGSSGQFDWSSHLTTIGGYLELLPIAVFCDVIEGRT